MAVKKEVVKEAEVVKEKVIDAKYLKDKIEIYLVQRKRISKLVDDYMNMHYKISGAIESAISMLKEEFEIDYVLPTPKNDDTTKSV